MRLPGVLIGLVGLVFLASLSSAQKSSSEKLRSNRKELEDIKSQLQETQQKVDSLRQLEENLNKAIGQYDEQVDRNRTLVKKLERQLKGVRGELSHNSNLLDSTSQRLSQKRENYKRVLVDYYIERGSATATPEWEFGDQLARSRRAYYLAALSGRTSHEMSRMDDSIKFLAGHIDSLKKTGSALGRLRKEKRAKISLDLTLKEKEETNLGSIKRQSSMMKDRLVSLSEVARQMEEIIARLEEEQARRKQEGIASPRLISGTFAQMKGRLVPPIKGRIVSSFGWKTDRITNLKSFSPGIDIKPSSGQKKAVACAPGRVVYIGQLRGYENFVILEHDDGFYTTYAGLSEIMVGQDDLVDAGEAVGISGNGNIHFEIRQGREHLDPVIWLDIDGF